MKIGILTYHRAHNYGAVLQAYALKTYLTALGHNVVFVDYWHKEHEESYKLFSNTHFKRLKGKTKIKYLISFLLSFCRKSKRRKGFLMFINKYLDIPRNAKYMQDDFLMDEELDVIIYGSDQIWRNHITPQQYIGFDSVYFGSNITDNVRLITYAVSMGIIDIQKEDEYFLKQALAKFSAILVRENKLGELVSKLGFLNNVVLDPVFLLNKKQWNKIINRSKPIQEKYILFYRLLPSEDAELFAKQLSLKTGFKLITITAIAMPFPKKNTFQTKNPVEFLQLIRNAEFVVNTSFHGTAFSLIFEKQFYTLGLNTNNDRALTLLSSINLKNRYINNLQNFDDTIEDINYEEVRGKLEKHINQSKSLLNNALHVNNE